MTPPHISAKKMLLAAALGGLVVHAWSQAKPPAEKADVPEPAGAPPPLPARPRHRLPVGKLAGALALISLIVVGMAFSASPSGSLEQPVSPARLDTTPISESAFANRHFYDLPVHVVTPPRAPVLPAPRPSERTVALARSAGMIGSTEMLAALEAERSELAQRVLADPRVHIYPAGRGDLLSGRVDPRVVAVIEYLADAYGEVSVSCLITGHSHFVHQTKKQKKLKLPRVVSAHIYGRAVDISAVAGITILGHQQPGGITERTIRQLMALPDWLRPRQLISLLNLGGPSFPLPDHANHIHVGY
jgi:hypothetical protein